MGSKLEIVEYRIHDKCKQLEAKQQESEAVKERIVNLKETLKDKNRKISQLKQNEQSIRKQFPENLLKLHDAGSEITQDDLQDVRFGAYEDLLEIQEEIEDLQNTASQFENAIKKLESLNSTNSHELKKWKEKKEEFQNFKSKTLKTFDDLEAFERGGDLEISFSERQQLYQDWQDASLPLMQFIQITEKQLKSKKQALSKSKILNAFKIKNLNQELEKLDALKKKIPSLEKKVQTEENLKERPHPLMACQKPIDNFKNERSDVEWLCLELEKQKLELENLMQQTKELEGTSPLRNLSEREREVRKSLKKTLQVVTEQKDRTCNFLDQNETLLTTDRQKLRSLKIKHGDVEKMQELYFKISFLLGETKEDIVARSHDSLEKVKQRLEKKEGLQNLECGELTQGSGIDIETLQRFKERLLSSVDSLKESHGLNKEVTEVNLIITTKDEQALQTLSSQHPSLFSI